MRGMVVMVNFGASKVVLPELVALYCPPKYAASHLPYVLFQHIEKTQFHCSLSTNKQTKHRE